MRLTKLCEADLREADLSETNLYEADLNGAQIEHTDFYNANLSGTILNKKEIIDSSQITNIAKAYSYSPNIQEVVEAQIKLINGYYSSVLQQAGRSFWLAWTAAGVGLVFFVTAVSILLFKETSSFEASTISLISGALVEVISGINFYLYGRASDQLEIFHVRLDKTQHFLLADAICESLEGDGKLTARAKLVETISNSTINALQEEITELKGEHNAAKKQSRNRKKQTTHR